jgi:hypothetical protein
LPLALIYGPGLGKSRCVFAASALVVLGAFSLLYVFIIGGQAYPLNIFPGMRPRAVSATADRILQPVDLRIHARFRRPGDCLHHHHDQRTGAEFHAQDKHYITD